MGTGVVKGDGGEEIKIFPLLKGKFLFLKI